MNTIQITNDEGVVVNYTEAEIKAIIKNGESHLAEFQRLFQDRNELRRKVFEFFNELSWDSGYDGGESTVYKDHVNDLLDEIGASRIASLYRATVSIEVEITDIEGTDEDEVRHLIEDGINLDLDFDGSFEINRVDVDNIDAQ